METNVKEVVEQISNENDMPSDVSLSEEDIERLFPTYNPENNKIEELQQKDVVKNGTYKVAVGLIQQIIDEPNIQINPERPHQCPHWMIGSIMKFLKAYPELSLMDYLKILKNDVQGVAEIIWSLNRHYKDNILD